MRLLAILGLLGFVLLWQKTHLASLFLLAPLYALYKENFLILWARKNIIKKATLNKNALFYRLTNKNSLLVALSFVIALFASASIALNLMYASHLDLAFLFLGFPLLFLLSKKALATQFRKNPYNTLRVVLVAAFFTAFFYALLQTLFKEKMDAFFYINNYLDMYKSSAFTPLDTLSQALHFVLVFKNFMLFWLDNFWAKALIFGFDFVNFFVLCSSFALLCSFTLKGKFSLVLSLIFGLLAVIFYNESFNVKPKYQEKISLYLKNLELPLSELDLSTLQRQNELYKANLVKFKELLDKNALEIGIWWLSKEKDELKKSLKRSLP